MPDMKSNGKRWFINFTKEENSYPKHIFND